MFVHGGGQHWWEKILWQFTVAIKSDPVAPVTMEEQSKQYKPDYYDELPKKPNFILFKVAKGAHKDLGRPKEPPQVNKSLYMKTLGSCEG